MSVDARATRDTAPCSRDVTEDTEAALPRAERLDSDDNAGITSWRHGALQAARKAERDIANGN